MDITFNDITIDVPHDRVDARTIDEHEREIVSEWAREHERRGSQCIESAEPQST